MDLGKLINSTYIIHITNYSISQKLDQNMIGLF